MLHVNHHRGCSETTATRADGTEWPHVLILHDGTEVCADTAAETLSQLIPDYLELSPEEQAEARTRHAVECAARLQEIHARRAGVTDRGVLAVLEAPKSSAMTISDPERPGAAPRWDLPVTLVLSTHLYAPHGDVPAPGGNVAWLDPTDEQRLLDSLGDQRVYDYWRDRSATG